MMPSRVDLPQPDGPITREDLALAHREIDLLQRHDIAVAMPDLLDDQFQGRSARNSGSAPLNHFGTLKWPWTNERSRMLLASTLLSTRFEALPERDLVVDVVDDQAAQRIDIGQADLQQLGRLLHRAPP